MTNKELTETFKGLSKEYSVADKKYDRALLIEDMATCNEAISEMELVISKKRALIKENS